MRYIPLLLIIFFTIISAYNIYQHQTKIYQRSLSMLGLIYLTLLEIIVFTPISFDGSAVYIMSAGIGRVNLTQLDILNLGFFENIVLTVPLGMLIKSSFEKNSIVEMAVIGVFVGTWIEIVQFYLSNIFLINRSSDINDVIANALGVIVGAIIIQAVARIARSYNLVDRYVPVIG